MTKELRPKNAFKHGVHSMHIVLPWEDEEEFNTLHQGLREDFFPDGTLQEETVLEIAYCKWRKRRLVIGSHMAFLGPNGSVLREAGKRGLEGVVEYLHQNDVSGPTRAALYDLLENKVAALLRTVEDVESKISELPDDVKDIEDEQETIKKALIELFKSNDMNMIKHFLGNPLERQEEEPPTEQVILMKELVVEFGELVQKQKMFNLDTKALIKKIDELDENRAWSNSASRPDLIERDLKIEAEIDRQIDKHLARLVNLKEFKRLYGQKQVVSPPPALTHRKVDK